MKDRGRYYCIAANYAEMKLTKFSLDVQGKSNSLFQVYTMPYDQGYHGQGKVSEKLKFFKVWEKSGNCTSSQGNCYFFFKVSEKSLMSIPIR